MKHIFLIFLVIAYVNFATAQKIETHSSGIAAFEYIEMIKGNE